MSLLNLGFDTSPDNRLTLDQNLHIQGSCIIDGAMFSNSTAAPSSNTMVTRDWVESWTPNVLLIANVGSLPSGTPAGVIVVTEA